MKKLLVPWVLFVLQAITFSHPALTRTSQKAQFRYTLLTYPYATVVKQSQRDIQWLIDHNNAHKNLSVNQLIDDAGYYFEHIKHTPYHTQGAMGEGACLFHAKHRLCPHIQQDPIYRTDGLDCVTLVNIIMALIHSRHLRAFHQNLLQIIYGANQNTPYPIDEISYRNRNHFISYSFNPVNESRHRLKDATNQGLFKKLTQVTQATINPRRWFAKQARPKIIAQSVRVLNAKDGQAMADKLSNPFYAKAFPTQTTRIRYIPKEVLAKKIILSSHRMLYVTYQKRINDIPTPSVLEIVRDIKRWNIGGKNVQKLIGSGMNISHIALLYRHHFVYGQMIYHHIHCVYDKHRNKTCHVTPIICQHKTCDRVMMLAASNAYPNGYVWSENIDTGKYYCTAKDKIPQSAIPRSTCNRVMSIPLADYLTRQEYGKTPFMDTSSILGIHIEKILSHVHSG